MDLTLFKVLKRTSHVQSRLRVVLLRMLSHSLMVQLSSVRRSHQSSPKGIEVNNIFLQGDATVSRNITVGIATPALAGNAGDIVFNANPTLVDMLDGCSLPTANGKDSVESVTPLAKYLFSLIESALGLTTAGTTLQVGSGSSMVAIDGDGVGIGTTANGFSLHVNGNANHGRWNCYWQR